MSIDTLPRTAVDRDGDGLPRYPFRCVATGDIRFSDTPCLPDPGCQWVDLPDGDPRPHIPLDRTRVAQLLFASHNVLADTDDERRVLELLDRQLRVCRCNPAALTDQVAEQYGDHPIEFSRYMTSVLDLLARLFGMSRPMGPCSYCGQSYDQKDASVHFMPCCYCQDLTHPGCGHR